MKFTGKKLASATLIGMLSIPAFSAEFITIGTGGVTGTYYPTGVELFVDLLINIKRY